ncbi:hypothetical protein RvY_05056 [Ramazzottius varieornatus]|uniref:K Homology domain-containing protein n=1 Tax=Ramazzottius varieornatus TaxID=947166 RepID=A0A1D1V0G0_RAMVA|nr:hypothetical protein RvY_05056 [Ramazzottius varieornatus]
MPNVSSPLNRGNDCFSFEPEALAALRNISSVSGPIRSADSVSGFSISDTSESTSSLESSIGLYDFRSLGNGKQNTYQILASVVESDVRVILKMEVDHREHSFLIGVRGDKVNAMRSACSCHIHYPDSKDGASGKVEQGSVMVNEVIVRGKIHNVILGAQKVREAVPFNFVYTVQQMHYFRRSVLYPQLVEEISKTSGVFGVEANYAMKENGEMQVFIRGPQSPRTLLGVRTICKMFSASPQEEHQVTQSICVHPNSQSSMWVFCDGERWLKMLSRVTGVQIAFPNPRGNNGDQQTVTISGSVHGVAAAWIVLMSMMPVTLRLNIPPNLDEASLRALHQHITKDLHVNFLAPRSVPASEGQQQYIELKSYEGNLDNICRAYRRIVGNSVQVPKFKVATTAESLVKMNLHTALPGVLRVVSDPATAGKESAINPAMLAMSQANNGWYPPAYLPAQVAGSSFPQTNSGYPLGTPALTPESIRVAAQVLRVAQELQVAQEIERRKQRKKEKTLQLQRAALLVAQTMNARGQLENQGSAFPGSGMSYDEYMKAQYQSKKDMQRNTGTWETAFNNYSVQKRAPMLEVTENVQEEAQLWQQYPNQSYLADLDTLVQTSAPSTPQAVNNGAFSFGCMDLDVFGKQTQQTYQQGSFAAYPEPKSST